MKSLEKYAGIFPAFYCCYDEAGEISKKRCGALAKFLLDQGVQGLYVEGSSGEGFYHSVEEREQVLEAVLDAVGGKLPVIAHIAAFTTRDSIRLAKHAEQAGADAIAAVPGIYYHLSEDMVERYWEDIMASVSLDMIIYNIPQTTHFSMSPELFRRMLEHKQIIGVKNSSPDVLDIQRFKALGKECAVIFNGPDEQYAAGRMMGADGGIGGTYAVMPEVYLRLEQLLRQGKLAAAAELQGQINKIIFSLYRFPSMLAACKGILDMRGIPTGGVRLPLLPLRQEDAPAMQILFNRVMKLVQS